MRNRLIICVYIIVAVVAFSVNAFASTAIIKDNKLKMVDSKGNVVTNAAEKLKKVDSSRSISKSSNIDSNKVIPKNAYEMAINKVRAVKKERNNNRPTIKLKQNTDKVKDNEEAEAKPNAIKVTKNAALEVRKERGKEPQLKVKLGGYHKSIKIGFVGGGYINDSQDRRLKKLNNGDIFAWNINDNVSGKRSVSYLGKTLNFRAIQPKHGTMGNVILDGKEYRGTLTVKFSEKGAIVINNVGMENYLRGVVGREMGSKSPKESLKAQTVIARTYAYRFIDRHKSDDADVCDSTHCQVYAGCSGESESVDSAVKETIGQIITYEGKPIEALYHATCGGYTSNNELVFGGIRNYLKRVKCEYCIEGTMYRWNKSVPLSNLRKMLSKEGIHIDSEIYDIKYESAGYMDRVDKVVFIGKKNTVKVKGTKIRALLNLPSTTFVIADRKKNVEKNRKNIKEEYQNDKKTGIIIISRVENTAPQYMVMGVHGLQRVPMPEGGWKEVHWTDKPHINEMKSVGVKQVLHNLDLFGRGFGHQVGLCQSGAVGLGKKGWSYREIIGLYYTGVTLYSLGYR